MILAFSCSKSYCDDTSTVTVGILSEMTTGDFFSQYDGLSEEDLLEFRAESIRQFLDIILFSYHSSLLMHGFPSSQIQSQLSLYDSVSKFVAIGALGALEDDYHTGKILHGSNFCHTFAEYYFPRLIGFGRKNGLGFYKLVLDKDAKGAM
jgi:hypothetical protein